jgi:hypothetical protein
MRPAVSAKGGKRRTSEHPLAPRNEPDSARRRTARNFPTSRRFLARLAELAIAGKGGKMPANVEVFVPDGVKQWSNGIQEVVGSIPISSTATIPLRNQGFLNARPTLPKGTETNLSGDRLSRLERLLAERIVSCWIEVRRLTELLDVARSNSVENLLNTKSADRMPTKLTISSRSGYV